MSDEQTDNLARSRQELGAARLLTEAGFGAQAISRAYFAAFFAAEAALLLLGETRSKHSGVISAFGRRVVREGRSRGVDRAVSALVVRKKKRGRLRVSAGHRWGGRSGASGRGEVRRRGGVVDG